MTPIIPVYLVKLDSCERDRCTCRYIWCVIAHFKVVFGGGYTGAQMETNKTPHDKCVANYLKLWQNNDMKKMGEKTDKPLTCCELF